MKCTLLHPCVKGLHTFPCDEVYAVGAYCFVIYSTILNWPPICCSGYKLSFNGPTHLFCNVYHNKVLQRLVHRSQFLKLFLICKTLTTSSNGNIFRITGPLWGESTGDQWIPLTNSSDAGLWCFPLCAPEQTVEQTVGMLVIWDVIALWRHWKWGTHMIVPIQVK